ncbi:hypothetical protein BCR33DRAFT_794935 [Rhizoclosmatium globosum]|uniref:Uncharacterized protein n=1 Tax=Rhizoclosmatium globosum TaxID=329046 RepID=A0A1Y2AUT9_9FUNG|nr:hypothetical protein BCR33DRAFT_794935 [Rhizoclosmatium globosum]|eukprot:ORY25967.1 hypothetical protein BCR33DRAFT_794935 [Rhizoclosmatium globosum]
MTVVCAPLNLDAPVLRACQPPTLHPTLPLQSLALADTLCNCIACVFELSTNTAFSMNPQFNFIAALAEVRSIVAAAARAAEDNPIGRDDVQVVARAGAAVHEGQIPKKKKLRSATKPRGGKGKVVEEESMRSLRRGSVGHRKSNQGFLQGTRKCI